MIMAYPATGSATYSVTLRNPDYGDVTRLENNTIIDRGFQDSLFTRQVTGKSKFVYYEYHLYVTQTNIAAVIELITAATGDVLLVNGKTGLIVTDPVEYTEVNPGQMHEVTFVLLEVL